MRVGASTTVNARFIVRSLLEIYITLGFLLKRDDEKLWDTFRVFGSGQAKLAFLKLETSAKQPSSISSDTLQKMANEDLWQEFLSIEVGHWAKSNLRDLATQAGFKDCGACL